MTRRHTGARGIAALAIWALTATAAHAACGRTEVTQEGKYCNTQQKCCTELGLSCYEKQGTQGTRCWADGPPAAPTTTYAPAPSRTAAPASATAARTATRTGTPAPTATPSGRCRTGTAIPAPITVSAADVAWPVLQEDGLSWHRGCVTTNPERGARQFRLIAGMPAVFRLVATLADEGVACQQELRKYVKYEFGPQDLNKPQTSWGHRSAVNHFLVSPPYYDIGPGARSTWSVDPVSDTYRIEANGLRDFRACLTTKDAAARRCALALDFDTVDPAVATLLDISVHDGRCVVNVPAAGAVPHEPGQDQEGQRGGLGQASGRCRGPADASGLCRTLNVPGLREVDIAQAIETLHAHGVKPGQLCGHPPDHDHASPQAAVAEYVAGARSIEEYGARLMPPFNTVIAPEWNEDPTDLQVLFAIADDLWAKWVVGQLAQDWGYADRVGKGHFHAHLCLGWKDDRLLVTPPCDDGLTPMDECPTMTCRQWIAEYAAEHGDVCAEQTHPGD